MSTLSKKLKSGRPEDEDTKIRQRVRDFLDGKLVTLIMTSATLWALFGDDIRLITTDKASDTAFYVSYVIMLALFVLDIFLNSIAVDDYKYSFFFWLDVIAAISLIPDIPFFFNYITVLFGGLPYSADVTVNTSTGASQSGQNIAKKVLKSFRLIRLVRIVKLYKYVTKRDTEEQEMRLKQAQKLAKTAKQAAMNREMDPTRLGKVLSDTTTRRVIIVVLLMVIFIPIMQVSESDNAPKYGLQQLFWMGWSSCTNTDQFLCDDPNNINWETSFGWYELVYRYTLCTIETDGKDAQYPLLWMYLPDYFQNGEIHEIRSIKRSDLSGIAWSQDENCSGKTVSSECNLRDVEMLLAVYTPDECKEKTVEGCENLQAYARFDIKTQSENDALMNIFTTLFVGFILTVAAVMFTADTQKILIGPITKMVLVIKSLADDPLKKIEKEEKTEDSDIRRDESTYMLEETVAKISALLQLSFGEDGADILSKNITSGEGELNLMRPGNKVSLVIQVIKVENFTLVSECLQEESHIFINKLSNIIHTCCKEWGGLVSKNIQGSFLLVWKLPEVNEKDTDEDDLSNPAMQRTDIANRALVSTIKTIAEIRRSAEIQAYKVHPRIISRFGPTFAPDLTIGVHIGWAIEGVIGSDFKIDPAYLSPHISVGYNLVEARKEYGCSVLMSEDFYGYLSVKAKNCCRRIDTVYVNYLPNTFGLYTFDITEKELPAPDTHYIGKLIKLAKLDAVNVENFQHKGVDYMFTLDSDITGLQQDIPQHFFDSFRHAYVDYISGQWEEAKEFLEKALTDIHEDGPSLSIKRYIEDKGKPVEDWPKSRELY